VGRGAEGFVTVPDVRQRWGRARVVIEHDKLGHVLGVGRNWADGEFSKPTPERDLLLCSNALIAKDQHFMLSKRGAYVVELGLTQVTKADTVNFCTNDRPEWFHVDHVLSPSTIAGFDSRNFVKFIGSHDDLPLHRDGAVAQPCLRNRPVIGV